MKNAKIYIENHVWNEKAFPKKYCTHAVRGNYKHINVCATIRESGMMPSHVWHWVLVLTYYSSSLMLHIVFFRMYNPLTMHNKMKFTKKLKIWNRRKSICWWQIWRSFYQSRVLDLNTYVGIHAMSTNMRTTEKNKLILLGTYWKTEMNRYIPAVHTWTWKQYWR